MKGGAFHQDASVVQHRRRFRINGKQAQRSFSNALKTLEENEEALRLALEHIGSPVATRTSLDVRTALRLLVEGPSGEFR